MNEIGNAIVSTKDGKAKYDETLKELLANKQILARILKRFVPEFLDCSLEDIENIYIEPESVLVSETGVERNTSNIDGIANEDATLNEGRIYYDIIFKVVYPHRNGALIGMYINIEAQNAYHIGYPIEMRGVYYAARRLSSQLKSINNDINYACLQKVYSIWICMGDVPNYEAGTATLYHMEKCDMIGKVDRISDVYDLLNVVVLRMNDKIKTEDEVLSLLQVLCSNLINKVRKLSLLRDHGIRIDDPIEEGVDDMCNLSDLVEARGEARGEQQRAKKVALKMLHDKLPYESIVKYTEIPLETIKEWEKSQPF